WPRPTASWVRCSTGACLAASVNMKNPEQTSPSYPSGDSGPGWSGCDWMVLIPAAAMILLHSCVPGLSTGRVFNSPTRVMVMPIAPSKLVGSGGKPAVSMFSSEPYSSMAHLGWNPCCWANLVNWGMAVGLPLTMTWVTPSVMNWSTACWASLGGTKYPTGQLSVYVLIWSLRNPACASVALITVPISASQLPSTIPTFL